MGTVATATGYRSDDAQRKGNRRGVAASVLTDGLAGKT